MKKKMTKKELERYIERKFAALGTNKLRYIGSLCLSMPEESGWEEHWNTLNTRDEYYCHDYFNESFSPDEISFLRLLSLHLFVRGM